MKRRTWFKAVAATLAGSFLPWKTTNLSIADDDLAPSYSNQCERIVNLLKQHKEWCIKRGAPLFGKDASQWDVSVRENEIHGVPRIRVQWERHNAENRSFGNCGVVLVNPVFSSKCDGIKLTRLLISACRKATDPGLIGLSKRLG